MRKLLQAFFVGSLLLFSIPSMSLAFDHYQLDSKHSYVQFEISHFGFSNQTGKWMVDGDLLIDQQDLNKSKATATIKVADVITGVPKLDEHLQGKLFFNTAEYPDAKFVTTHVRATGATTAVLEGDLTLHGVTKPVTIIVKLNKQGINPLNDVPTVGFTGAAKIKRSDFEMKALLPGLGDEVKLYIQVEAKKVSEK